MIRRALHTTVAVLALTGLAGCVAASPQPPVASTGAPVDARYRGVRTNLLEGDLVNFIVTMEGARDSSDVIAYAQCAAAQYALIRGYAFARHVRTSVQQQGGLWRADAVYTVSPDLPRGSRTIDAEITVADCTEQGIPTV
ncbi:MAG: hypothetical protein R3D60_03405 [Paracoccaceae bacterium]